MLDTAAQNVSASMENTYHLVLIRLGTHWGRILLEANFATNLFDTFYVFAPSLCGIINHTRIGDDLKIKMCGTEINKGFCQFKIYVGPKSTQTLGSSCKPKEGSYIFPNIKSSFIQIS